MHLINVRYGINDESAHTIDIRAGQDLPRLEFFLESTHHYLCSRL